jgi:site-specific DNA recombinase
MKKRPEFLKMIELARAGEIDLILVKSISRFARNTVDVLILVRELREIGCIIYFEKENIYSNDPKIDFVLTVLSSIAQEESRSISTNVKWSVQKRFKEGKIHISRIFGYTKDEKGNLVINAEEAKIVKLIFSLYIQGYSINDIKKTLVERNLGDKNWLYSTIRAILSNEKYSGDALLQKTVTTDYLTHKQVKNDNIETKYFVRDSHEAIITRAEYETVQSLLSLHVRTNKHLVTKYPLTHLVYCSKCGRQMHRHSVSHGRPSEHIVLDCKHNPTIRKSCDADWIRNDLVMNAVQFVMNKMISKKELKSKIFDVLAPVTNTDALNDELFALKEKLASAPHEKLSSIKKQMKVVQSKITSTVKNQSLINLINSLIDSETLISNLTHVKNFFQLIALDGLGRIFFVISKSHTTEDLVKHMDSIIKLEPIYNEYFVDIALERGLNCCVIIYE